MYQIYSISDPRYNTVFYVGVTHDIRKRIAQHLRSKTRVGQHIAKLVEVGIVPTWLILEQVERPEEANERENFWSHFYTVQGMELLPGIVGHFGEGAKRGCKFTSQESERLYQEWLNGGPCPWKRETDYIRKFVNRRSSHVSGE
jgi:predicted GIY-YIG superfamily endonuclease